MDLNTLREYINIHRISMEQDLDNIDGADYMLPYLEGAIAVSNHYLEYINEQ
jgi:hypothetical protein